MNVSYNNLFLIKNAIFNKRSRACLYTPEQVCALTSLSSEG